jgi:serine/threonine-protein kinase
MPLRRVLFLLPLAALAAWLVVRWGELPERLATSFDFAGHPRDWTSRGGFAALMLGLCAGSGLLLAGLAAWLPRVPDAWINVPDKAWWLAPERRAATLSRVALVLDLVNLATSGFLAALGIALCEANRPGGAMGPEPQGLIALYVVAVVALVLWMWIPFSARRRALRSLRGER